MRGSSAQQCVSYKEHCCWVLWQLAMPTEMLRNVLETGTCGCVSGSVVVSLVAEVQYSTGTSLLMFSGFKLL